MLLRGVVSRGAWLHVGVATCWIDFVGRGHCNVFEEIDVEKYIFKKID